MDVLEAIKTRRSVRRYRADPIDDKTLEVVLEAARLAPSWANTQCWRFIIVRDAALKSQLAGTLTGMTEKPNRAALAITNAPVVIVACAELGKSGYKQGAPATDKGDWFMFDVALAMENLALAAHSLGLGTVHVGLFDARRAAAILNVPDGFCVVEMAPLGYPDEVPRVTLRKEPPEIFFHDQFGK